MDFLQYVLQEVKSRRLSHSDALEVMRQYRERAGVAVQPRAADHHPLLQRNSSTLAEQRFSTTFTGDEFFLADHVVQGSQVLPGAVHLEMARAAVAAAAELTPDDGRVVLRDVVFARPAVVGPQPLTLHIALESRDDGAIGFEIFSDGDGEPLVHSQGRAVIEPAAEAPAAAGLSLAGEQAWDAAACYDAFARMGLAYGPAHRPLLTVRAGRDAAGNAAVAARLALPDQLRDEAASYGLHPSLLDGAFQATIGLLPGGPGAAQGRTMVPFAIDAVQVYAPLPAEADVYVRLSDPQGAAHRESERLLDVDIADPLGRLAVRIQGFRIRALDGQPAGEPQDRPATAPVGELTLAPAWEVEAAAGGEAWPARGEGVVILASDPASIQGLAGWYPQAASCVLDPAASVEQLTAQLQGAGTIAHLFWIVPPAAGVGPAVRAAQPQGVLAGFRIVKALLALGGERRELGLTVVTTQSQAIAAQEQVFPAHAGVHGLVGSLAKEFPNWRVRLVDLPATGEWPLAELLALPADGDGQARVFRHGQWYRQRLLPCTLPEAAPVYRRNGVYVVLGGAGGIGEAFSEYLVREYQAQLVWIGRRPEDEAIRQKLDRIAACGVRPLYLAADATDAAALADACARVKARFGAIHGVVHAMLVLADQSLARMDEARFVAALAPKVDASVNLVEVFGHEPLDFVLFFSSLQSFTMSAGQSNYAAGCTFTDAYAQALRAAFPWPAKVVNWGYWGTIGVVASEDYRSRMRRVGIDSIEPPEAMALLERLLAGPQDQLAFLKTHRPEAAMALGVAGNATLRVLPAATPAPAALPEDSRQPLPMDTAGFADSTRAAERCAAGLLFAQLAEFGLFSPAQFDLAGLQARLQLPAMYWQWLAKSLDVLVQHGLLACGRAGWIAEAGQLAAVPALRAAWEQHRARFQDDPEQQAHIRLVDAALHALPAILAGRTPATAVLFPNASVSAVEGIYKHNRIADYFNEVLAEVLVREIEQRLRRDPEARFRLFEIGAGTGGTSALLFERLAPYAAHLAEYGYSDISRAFLLHAEQRYLPQAPYLQTRLFNVEQAPGAQGIDLGGYDFVVATNVLHATRDMRQTLGNAKALLKAGGLLLVNEIASFNLFTHLTFGLLEGWWLHTDTALRIPGSPALAPDTWRFLLESEGYAAVAFPASHAHGFGQQIIAARSNGIIRQVQAATPRPAVAAGKPMVTRAAEPPGRAAAGVEVRLQAALAAMVSAQLKIHAAEIDAEASLHELGFDSITLTAFVNALNGRYGLDLTPTVLFEHSTLAGLARYLATNQGAALRPHFGLADPPPVEPRPAAALPEAGAAELAGRVQAALAGLVSIQLKIKPEDIDGETSLHELGFDSITLTAFANALNSRYGLELTPTVLFEHSTLARLAEHLLGEHRAAVLPHFAAAATVAMQTAPAVAAIPDVSTRRRRGRAAPAAIPAAAAAAPVPAAEPVAIIGVSGRFPQAADIDALWENLTAGRDCIGEIPDSRWDWRTLYGDPTAGGNHSNVKHAGVIDGVDEFDPQFFGISPREAESMDPQQRLLMMYVWKAIEDAGYAPHSLSGSRTALLIGTSGSGYANLLQRAGGIIEGYSSTGAVASVGPNRMSFLLNLHGPSEPVETACSSALVALHRAVKLLQSGECELAITGGVNTLVSPEAHISFNKAGMLSPDGRCKTFSSDANGYVRGEGVGMLVLKPLSAAERDGDRIYAVIRGSAENHGGRANSLTAPNPRAQADLIKAAITQAGIDPATIGYIEAHGTGTPLGDPVEVQGLKTAFRELAAAGNQALPAACCGLGSIKTNIGHLELAAGVAGVIKVLLQLQHRTLVPSLHCATINPYIELDGSPFYVVRENRPWLPPQDPQGRTLPRRAGVSSFGFGGVNAHVVLEEYVPAQRRPAVPATGPFLVVLSARNAERLQDQVRQLLRAIETRGLGQDELPDLAYTLQVGRDAMEARLACVVSRIDELKDKLAQYLANGPAADHLYCGEARRNKEMLAVFAADDELQEAIGKWIGRGKLGKLADLWVKGLAVDWAQLHGGARPRRIGLPTYPFAGERYWVPAGGARPAAGAVAAVRADGAPLHPLLGGNTSTLAQQRFSTVFTGEEPFLADHVVHGVKVLPGVAHLEMARAAALHSLEPGRPPAALVLRNVVFSRPLAVARPPLECHIALQPEADGRIAFRIYSQPAADAEPQVYSQGSIECLEPGATASPRHDLAALREACGRQRVPGAQVDAYFADKGLDFGPTFRAIQEIHVDGQQALARLESPEGQPTPAGRFMLDPGLLDAAIRASAGLLIAAGEIEAPLGLPFVLERLDIYRGTTPCMWSYLRSSSDGRTRKLDVDLCDEAGQVCVRFTGLSVRTFEAAGSGPAGTAARDAAATLLLQPEWRLAPAAEADQPPPADHLVLLCDSAVDPAVLAGRLGARCEALPQDYAGQAEVVLARLLAARPAGPLLVQLVVPEFGPQQMAAGLAGLVRSARLEHSQLIGQVIAVDREDDAGQLAAKLLENRRCPQDVQIRYAEGERQVLGWRELADLPAQMPWKDGGVYLLTGGLGGLGRLFAKEIAARAKGAVLILAGRRPLDDAGRQRVRELEALGATVQYQLLDVADSDAVRRLVLQVQETHEALDGILHCAGLTRDCRLAVKTPEILREVLAAKVPGLINLDEASREIELDCFICCSSIAALLGNVGQADYAAANAFMDAYAAYRNSLVAIGQRHGRTLSVNWPLWRDGGMRVDAATERALAATTGIEPLPAAEGIDALYRAWGSGLDQVAVAFGRAARIRQVLTAQPADPGAGPVAATAAGLPPAAGGDVVEGIKGALVSIVAALAKVAPEAIDGETALHEYGFDSIMMTELGNRLNHEFRLELVPAVFFEYPTLDELAGYLGSRHAAQFRAAAAPTPVPAVPPERAAAAEPPAPARQQPASAWAPLRRPVPSAGTVSDTTVPAEPIAIIGLSGRFPQAADLDALWDNLCSGRDCVTEVPAGRWDMAPYYDPQPGRPGKSASKWGGFIDGIEQFDALFFHISPREAAALDPQARLLLQTVWRLLESGGHTRESLQQRYQGRVGVYVGAAAQPASPQEGAAGVAGPSMQAASAIANRLSYFFNCEGPSIAIDTMCSSSMMAIHLACRDLQQGECALAVAGGVNLLLSPQRYVQLSQAQLLGSHPHHRSFGEGDGYQPAETVGAVLLKPLRQAEADGDPILAVIAGTAIGHSGRANGYATPNPKVQARVMAESLRRAGATADSIGWVEATATGAGLADAIEVAALAGVFGGVQPPDRRIPVGTVKSHLGNPELASGIAQLAKVVLQLQHRQLVPLLDIGQPNRQLRLDGTPLVLQREPAAWEPLAGPAGGPLPRRALVNSFGAGGTCVSAVIEEYLPPTTPDTAAETPAAAQLFVFSARTGERLRAVVERARQRLDREPQPDLRGLACTLQVGREAMDRRLAVVAASHAELAECLQAFLDGRDPAGLPLYHSPDEASLQSLQRLLRGAAGESLLAAMLAERDLAGLALYWVQGGTVPWEKLHGGRLPRRIAWPTYPFAETPVGQGAVSAPAPEAGAAALHGTEPAAPGAGIEPVIVAAVAAALGIATDELPLHQPLRALGYNSLAAMELKYRLEVALRRPVELAQLSDAGCAAAELARRLAAAQPEQPGPAAALPVLVPDPAARHDPFPLTDMQEAFLLGRKSTIAGDRIGAHVYAEFEVAGPLDIFRLNQAWNRLVARHDMLRAVFGDAGWQRVLPRVRDYRFKVVDLRRLGEAERRFKAGLLRDTMEHHVFAGGEWPLFDIRVAIHGEGRYRIHFSIDELIADGLSVDRLLREWDCLYSEPEQQLPPLALTFRDYVLAMRALAGTAKYQQDLAYWRNRLANLPGGPEFPRPVAAAGDAAGDEDATNRRTRLHHRLPAAGWQAMQAKAAALGISPTALVLGVFAEVLRAWSGSPAFTLVLTQFNRPPLHPQIRELVGPAISSLLFVVEPAAGADFEGILKAHHHQLWEALDHGSVSGIEALRQSRAQGGRGVAPRALPVVFTSLLGAVAGEPPQSLGRLVYAVNQTPQVYLDHQLSESAAGLDLSWDVAEGRFAPGFVRAMFDAYAAALAGLADGRLPWALASFVRPAAVADPTVAQLAGFLAEAQQEDPLAPFPLTDQQQAYAFGRDTRLAGGGSSCQFYQELRIERLDVARLEQVLATLTARHPALRTVVDAEGSQAVLAEAPRYEIAVADLRRLSPEERQATLAGTRHELLGRARPLGEWPYFTVTVSLLEAETACVHLCFDLMLVDSTSISQLLIELVQLYEQPQNLPPAPALGTYEREGENALERDQLRENLRRVAGLHNESSNANGPFPAQLQPAHRKSDRLLSFRDYQRAVERFKGTPGYTERLGYWTRKFAGLPGGPMLPQLPAAAAAADAHQRISGELVHWGTLKQHAAAQGVAPSLILLTAYLEVLHAWNGQQPLAVVVPGWERLPVHPDIERVVGDFTTLSWVTRGPEGLSFAERLAQVARQHADDLAQRPVSGLQALRRVMLKDRHRQLRYPVVFTNQITPLALHSTQFQLGEALSKTPQVYLDNLSSEAGSRLHCSWDFAGGVYAPAMVNEMFDGYLRLLERLGSDGRVWQRSDFSELIRARPAVYGTAVLAVAP